MKEILMNFLLCRIFFSKKKPRDMRCKQARRGKQKELE